MTARMTSELLRSLRNDIPIDDVIQLYLQIPNKWREGALRFICPICREMNTATNKRTNLARCFTCSKNFNTIDIVIATRRCSFLQATKELQDTQNRRAKMLSSLADLISSIGKKL